MPRTPTTGHLAYEKIAALVAAGESANKAALAVGTELGITQSAAAQSYYRYKKMNESGTPVVFETVEEKPVPKRRGRPPKAKAEPVAFDTPTAAASNGGGFTPDEVLTTLNNTLREIGTYIGNLQAENATLKQNLADAQAQAANFAALRDQIAALT